MSNPFRLKKNDSTETEPTLDFSSSSEETVKKSNSSDESDPSHIPEYIPNSMEEKKEEVSIEPEVILTTPDVLDTNSVQNSKDALDPSSENDSLKESVEDSLDVVAILDSKEKVEEVASETLEVNDKNEEKSKNEDSNETSLSKEQTKKVDKKDQTTKEEKKRIKEKKKEVDPTKPPKPSLSQKISSWSKEAKEAKDSFLEASAPQSDSYSFEDALQNHKPSLPTQKEPANLSTPLSAQAFMMKNPGKPLGLSQVLQVCMASVWIYLGLSFMLGMMLGVPLNLATNYEMYLMVYSIIFWSTTTITGSMAIAYGSSILKVNPFKALQNIHFKRHWIWKGFSMMVAANLILSIITTFFMDLFSTFVFPLAPSPDFDVTGMPLFAGALEFVIVCLIGPVFEEMLYRGLIYRNLSRFNQGFAIVFSALLFGLAHGNLGQAVPTFGVGLVLAYAYAKSNSIWVPIILHILNNTCLMFISTFPIVDIVISIILWITLFVGIWVFYQERKEWRAMFYQANQDGQPWSLVAHMPSFWLYIVAFLILSVI